MEYPNLEQDFREIPESIVRSMATRLTDGLEKCGLYYRLFTRTKTAASTRAKLKAKNYQNGKRMQDLFGIRIAVYFQDDQALCRKMCIRDRPYSGQNCNPSAVFGDDSVQMAVLFCAMVLHF